MKTITSETSDKSRQREELILALLKYPSLANAAASIGISTADALRIRNTREFAAEYSKASRAAFSQALGQIHIAANAAVATLWATMIDPWVSDTCRVRAADSLLKRATEIVAIEQLNERIRYLEERAEALQQQFTSAVSGKEVGA